MEKQLAFKILFPLSMSLLLDSKSNGMSFCSHAVDAQEIMEAMVYVQIVTTACPDHPLNVFGQ